MELFIAKEPSSSGQWLNFLGAYSSFGLTVSVFECSRCGNCCEHLRGRISEEDARARSPYIFMLVPPSLMTLGLHEWELPGLREKAVSLSIDLRIRPSMVMWDETSKTALTIMWNLDHEDCPFFSQERICKIYKDRPLVCQTFPLITAGLLSHVIQRISEPLRIGYGTCPSVPKVSFQENKPLFLGSRHVFKELFRAFGEAFVGSLRYEYATIMVRDLLKDAETKGKICISPMNKEIVKSILRSKPVGALAFLESKGLLSEAELKDSVRSIESFTVKSLQERLGVN